MIKAILFDLDGVLVDADEMHFDALNQALVEFGQTVISWAEHQAIYQGLTTNEKLLVMSERGKLARELSGKIFARKQELTALASTSIVYPDYEKIAMLKDLSENYRVAVCSNAKRATVESLLKITGLYDYCHLILSSDDVIKHKPDPEIYQKAIRILGIRPEECLIVEDSQVGRQAALASNAQLCAVSSPKQVNSYTIKARLNELNRINVVIPAAGIGKRFVEVGMCYPKPLIPVAGKPMLQLVLSNFNNIGKPIVLLQSEHIKQYSLDKYLPQICPGIEIIAVDSVTEGAACTVLLSESKINNCNELLIANSDQFLDYDLSLFINEMRTKNADGGILTFKASHPKWSYAKVNEFGEVTEVAEKKVISEHATVGVYYFRKGSDFVSATRSMIAQEIKVNGEYYVCPVFNELIKSGAKVYIHSINNQVMHGLGTPEDLANYIKKIQDSSLEEKSSII